MQATKSIFIVIIVFTLLFGSIGQVSGKPTNSEGLEGPADPLFVIYLPLIVNGTGSTQNPPNAAKNPSPANGAGNQSLNPVLSWTGSDPDGDALVYDVYLDLHNPPTTKVATHQSAATFSPGPLAGNTIYFWKVVSFDTQGASTANAVWLFSTLNSPPNQAANPSPADGTLDQSLSTTLSWTGSDPDGEALVYDVYLDASNPTPTTKVADHQNGTTFTPSLPLAYTTYYWKVVSFDAHEVSTASPVWQFSTLPANMVYVPAGEFQMGCDGDYNGGWGCDTAVEGPKHTVYLDAYFIDKTEVTTAQYAECVAAGQCNTPYELGSSTRTSYYGNSTYANFPVIYVDWINADKYCTWVDKSLPTEAEWEKAARGTTPRPYPWGDESPNCSLANSVYQPDESRCVGDTTAVGSYPTGASPYGALDMAGNVEEWVSDWYSDDYVGNYYAISPYANPSGPSTGTNKLLRGGSWNVYPYFIRAAYRRDGGFPDAYGGVIGFRCVSPAP